MVQVFFDDIKTQLIEAINAAEKQVLIAIAWFTDRELYRALLSARRRSVIVKIVIMRDVINCSAKSLDFASFTNGGGELYFFQSLFNLMHNKYCIIDENIVFSGSYNWTYSALGNSENVIKITQTDVARQFINQFEKLLSDESVSRCHAYTPIDSAQAKIEDTIKIFPTLKEEVKLVEEHENTCHVSVGICFSKNSTEKSIFYPMFPLNSINAKLHTGEEVKMGGGIGGVKPTFSIAIGTPEFFISFSETQRYLHLPNINGALG